MSTQGQSGSDLLIDLNPDGLPPPNQDAVLPKNVALANLHANEFMLPSGSTA